MARNGLFLYMGKFDRIILNIKKLDHVEILVKILNRDDVKRFIIDLNTEKQLALGLDSEGDILGFYKSFTYSSFKQRIGSKAPFGVIDLKVEEDYFRTFVVEVLNNGDFIIDSNTLKPDRDLRKIQGISDNIEGLIMKNFDLFIDFIRPFFIDETREAILQ